MTQPNHALTRSYRVYLRDAHDLIARPHDVDLASDEDARKLATLMLNEQGRYPCVEVWDRARLVCTARRNENALAELPAPQMVWSGEADTRRFLRAAAVAIRELAVQAPEIAREMREFAADLEDEANDESLTDTG